MNRKTQNAINKYGRETCEKAYKMHHVLGEGAYTVGVYLGLTTNQADAAINAGRELAEGAK